MTPTPAAHVTSPGSPSLARHADRTIVVGILPRRAKLADGSNPTVPSLQRGRHAVCACIAVILVSIWLVSTWAASTASVSVCPVASWAREVQIRKDRLPGYNA